MPDESVFLEKSLIAKGRSRVYSLLSALYRREIGAEFLEALTSQEVAAVLADLGMDIRGLIPEEVTREGQKAFLDALAEEYAALFILPGGVSPYESVRIKGLLCQEPEWRVREFYKRCGLVVSEDSKIFADHIGMEFEFMGYLADRESQAWGIKGEEDAVKWCGIQTDFFNNHINKWVFGFLDGLDKLAFHPFYKEISVLTRRFMQIEREDLVVEKTTKLLRAK